MRRIDTREMVLVHYGREWTHPAPPCNKAMITRLERNETLVYWLQPKGRPTQEQIPALKLPDGFYTLSLRMMKAIWRHVRLRKGFCNLERAQLGGYKLRIPRTLLTEKMRTQSRFNVSARALLRVAIRPTDARVFQFAPTARRQTMRMSAQAARPQPKNPMSAANKITRVVSDFFLPIAEGYVPEYTPLSTQPDADETQLLERIWELFPDAMRSRDDFVDCMCQLYDSRGHGGKRARAQ